MFSLLSCKPTVEKQNVDDKLKENLIGDWKRINEKEIYPNSVSSYSSSTIPEGMAITNDSIEFYGGFFKPSIDSSSGKRIWLYLGNRTPYKINRDTITINNPLIENEDFNWKFISRINDTLTLAVNDTSIIKYKESRYNMDTLPDFDQIIYSSSGCLGSCPIMDISIDRKGNVLYQGEGYVKPLGFYTAKLNLKKTKYIFNKFRRANPLGLSDKYSVFQSDGQLITTTYIKDGKIVKTIHDYGGVRPNELIWAYIPIANIQRTLKFEALSMDIPYLKKLHSYTLKKNNLSHNLEKSVSFYLWTELEKAKKTEEQFKHKYKLSFDANNYYWGPNPNRRKKHQPELKSILTDGQFYKFEFKNGESTTYDLGYNFMELNLKNNNFRIPEVMEIKP